LFERPETEIRFVLANGMFKMKIDIDRHGPRPMPNNCKNFNPPNFSLPTTFKDDFPASCHISQNSENEFELEIETKLVPKPGFQIKGICALLISNFAHFSV
jgi:hypothetical protein